MVVRTPNRKEKHIKLKKTHKDTKQVKSQYLEGSHKTESLSVGEHPGKEERQ